MLSSSPVSDWVHVGSKYGWGSEEVPRAHHGSEINGIFHHAA